MSSLSLKFHARNIQTFIICHNKAIHQNDSKYYLQFCTVSGPRIETLELVTLLTQLETLKIGLGRHFGSVYVVKIQLFGFSLVPCHFILQIICTSHFLDK